MCGAFLPAVAEYPLSSSIGIFACKSCESSECVVGPPPTLMPSQDWSSAWREEPQSEGHSDAVTRADLVRFAQRKVRQLLNSDARAHSRPSHSSVQAVLENQWGEFASFCAAHSKSFSDQRPIVSTQASNECGSVLLMEAYWAHQTSQQGVRHSSRLTEEMLLLCIPTMTKLLEARTETVEQRHHTALTNIATLSTVEPWSSRFADMKARMDKHVAHCESIEIDDRVCSAAKGEALDTLLSLRQEKAELVQLLLEEQVRMLPLVEPLKALLALHYRRLETHRSCRGQGRGVMQHLPSFQCTMQSDMSNDCWRPVHSALLFSGWELETRAIHDQYRDHLAAKGNVAEGEGGVLSVDDEVEFVQNLLREAMSSTAVARDDFLRLASMMMQW